MNVPVTWLIEWSGMAGRIMSLMITRRCPLHCRHCLMSPLHDSLHNSDLLTEQKLQSQIEAIDPAVYSTVSFVGGEPSLRVDLLRHGITLCRQCQLKSALVTAPIWAASLEKAHHFLDQVQGLDVLHLSFDNYHLECLAMEFYQNALTAATERGMLLSMNVSYVNTTELKHLNEGLLSLDHCFITSYTKVLPLGNGYDLLEIQEEGLPVEAVDHLLDLPRSCLAGNAYMDISENVYGCCWASLADRSPLAEFSNGSGGRKAIEQLENNPVFQTVRKGGMIDSRTEAQKEALVKFANGRRFVNECHLCLEAMKQNDGAIWRCSATD